MQWHEGSGFFSISKTSCLLGAFIYILCNHIFGSNIPSSNETWIYLKIYTCNLFWRLFAIENVQICQITHIKSHFRWQYTNIWVEIVILRNKREIRLRSTELWRPEWNWCNFALIWFSVNSVKNNSTIYFQTKHVTVDWSKLNWPNQISN